MYCRLRMVAIPGHSTVSAKVQFRRTTTRMAQPRRALAAAGISHNVFCNAYQAWLSGCLLLANKAVHPDSLVSRILPAGGCAAI